MKYLIAMLFGCFIIKAEAQVGNVGVGVTNPQARLHTAGSVRFDTLAGQGIRTVLTDANGHLFTPVYLSNQSIYNIPDKDCSGVTSTINVSNYPGLVNMSSLKLKVNITHPDNLDLLVYLVAPSGQIIILTVNSSGQNLYNTIFWDGSAQSIQQGSAPYNGIFRPLGYTGNAGCVSGGLSSFSALGTISPNGQWKLKVVDNRNENIGTLNNWSISFDGSEPGYNGLDVPGPLNTTSVTTTLTGDANMLPVAYGVVYSNATNSINSSSNNCTLVHPSAGTYIINFTGSNLSSYNIGNLPVILSLYGFSPGMISFTGTNGKITVYTFNVTGQLTDRGFSFAVLKP